MPQYGTSIILTNSEMPNVEDQSIYAREVQQHITRLWLWREPDGRPGNKAVVRFRVSQVGVVSDVAIEEISGNEAFDRNALNAVRLAGRLAGFPHSIDVLFLDGRMTFEATAVPPPNVTRVENVAEAERLAQSQTVTTEEAHGQESSEADSRDSSRPLSQPKGDVLSKQDNEIRQARTSTPEVKRTELFVEGTLKIISGQLENAQNYNNYFVRVRQRIVAYLGFWKGEGTPGMKAKVKFKLDPSGNVSEITLEESSGNEAFDREAVWAVRNGGPLPTIPSAMSVPFLDLAMVFEARE